MPQPVTVGSVTFFKNGVQMGASQPLNSSGQASYGYSDPVAETDVLTAHYGGVSGQFAGSTSPEFSEVVNPSDAPTSTAIVATPSPGTVGQQIVITATVTTP